MSKTNGVIQINPEDLSNCARFARKLVYGDHQYSRMLPEGIDEESEIAKVIETQRHFFGKVGEVAFYKKVEYKLNRMNEVLEDLKKNIEKNISNFSKSIQDELNENLYIFEENIKQGRDNLECAKRDQFKIYDEKTECDEGDFKVEPKNKEKMDKNKIELASKKIDIKTSYLHFHKLLQVNNKQFASEKLRADYYVGVHLNLSKEQFMILTNTSIYKNIEKEDIKSYILTKKLEDISFKYGGAKIFGYESHDKMKNNENKDAKEGACREKKLEELKSIDDLFNNIIFHEATKAYINITKYIEYTPNINKNS